MKTTPKKPSSWRRVLIYVVVMVFTLFIGIPTAFVLRTRSRISSAVRSASSVRLEEHSFNKVLSTRTLTPAEFQRVTEAIPLTLDFGFPGVVALCFIPHQRVIIAGANQQQTTFEVCFSCEQVQLSGHELLPTPSAWRQPLRELFLRHDIPIRDQYKPDFTAETGATILTAACRSSSHSGALPVRLRELKLLHSRPSTSVQRPRLVGERQGWSGSVDFTSPQPPPCVQGWLLLMGLHCSNVRPHKSPLHYD